MKNLILISMLFISVLSYSQTSKQYCIQVLSTENPHLLKPEHFSILPFDKPMVEQVLINDKIIYRIIFVYDHKDMQQTFCKIWQKDFPDALIINRTDDQISKLKPLFSELN